MNIESRSLAQPLHANKPAAYPVPSDCLATFHRVDTTLNSIPIALGTLIPLSLSHFQYPSLPISLPFLFVP